MKSLSDLIGGSFGPFTWWWWDERMTPRKRPFLKFQLQIWRFCVEFGS